MRPYAGFSLVELMVVVALIGVFMVMAPLGMITQHAALSLESAAYKVADQLRRCSLQAQDLELTLQWQSPNCPALSADNFDVLLSGHQPLYFLADGTSSGGQISVSPRLANKQYERVDGLVYLVEVDRITSLAKVRIKVYERPS